MPMIDGLSPARRKVLDALHAGSQLRAAIQTLRALQEDGFVERDSETVAGWKLTETGKTLYVESAMRSQKASDFHVGQQVERLDWHFEGKRYVATWRRAEVIKVGNAMLNLGFEDDQIIRRHMAMSIRPAAT